MIVALSNKGFEILLLKGFGSGAGPWDVSISGSPLM